MTFKPLEQQDCQNIVRTFEKGAAYSVTMESVYAQMTPLLTGIRIQSESLFQQLVAEEGILLPGQPKGSDQIIAEGSTDVLGGESPAADLTNMDKSNEETPSVIQKIKGQFLPNTNDANADGEGNLFGPLLPPGCLPCRLRVFLLGDLSIKKFLMDGKQYLDRWVQWLSEQISQITGLLQLFTPGGTAQMIDICAFIKWMQDFVCVPDLQRIISVLMALLIKTSATLGGTYDQMLDLVGPLMLPYVGGFVTLLQTFILLIVKPIECIIDSLTDLMRKLDFNVFFQDLSDIGEKLGASTASALSENKVKIPFIGVDIKFPESPISRENNPIANKLRREELESDAAVTQAAEELKAIQKAGEDVDASDAGALEKFRGLKDKAVEKYRDALNLKNKLKSRASGNPLNALSKGLKSALLTLIEYLKEAVEAVQVFWKELWDEYQKLMGTYTVSGNKQVKELTKKAGIIQMIALVTAMIGAFGLGMSCIDTNGAIRAENFIPKDQNMKVWTDEDGALHIEEDLDDVKDAIDAMVEAVGVSTTDNPKSRDDGNLPPNYDSSQRLRSLIEFTGDPVLDIEIARATEALVSPVKAVFKCPLQTSIEQTEQVNKWIEELNSE